MNSPKHEDERGFFQELYRSEFGLIPFAQISRFSIKPGKSRGHHYHKSLFETFILVEGSAIFISTESFDTDGSKATYKVLNDKNRTVDTKPYYHHAFYSEKGAEFIAMCTKLFDPKNPDTYPSELTKMALANLLNPS